MTRARALLERNPPQMPDPSGVHGESAHDRVRGAVRALAESVDGPFRKTGVMIGAGGLHVHIAAICAQPLEALAGALPPGEARCDGFVTPYAFVAETLRCIAFQRDTESCHFRRQIGSFRESGRAMNRQTTGPLLSMGVTMTLRP